MLETGIKGRCSRRVEQAITAQAMGSGSLEVLATPALAAMIEQAAWESVAPYLEPGQTTVGALLELHHDSPTPLGVEVWAESELVEAAGRRLVFTAVAYDQTGPIGSARHERVIVDGARFMGKCQAKATGL